MVKYLIIAGNYHQFTLWARKALLAGTIDNIAKASFANAPRDIRGRDWSKVGLVFYGDWRDNPIFNTLEGREAVNHARCRVAEANGGDNAQA